MRSRFCWRERAQSSELRLNGDAVKMRTLLSCCVMLIVVWPMAENVLDE